MDLSISVFVWFVFVLFAAEISRDAPLMTKVSFPRAAFFIRKAAFALGLRLLEIISKRV